MKIDRNKLELELARACMRQSDLIIASGVPACTLQHTLAGKNIRPENLGKIARALGVSPEAIVKAEETDT